MANDPAPPWWLRCTDCVYAILVGARGVHGGDQGAGVEAAEAMRGHVEREHGMTWTQYLNKSQV